MFRANPLHKNHFAKTKDASILSSGASRGAPHGVASLKERQGAFGALNKGSGALGKVK